MAKPGIGRSTYLRLVTVASLKLVTGLFMCTGSVAKSVIGADFVETREYVLVWKEAKTN
jgi:hypothetical protein